MNRLFSLEVTHDVPHTTFDMTFYGNYQGILFVLLLKVNQTEPNRVIVITSSMTDYLSQDKPDPSGSY